MGLRVHALLHSSAEANAPAISAYCHEDVVVLEHGAPYENSSENRAAHVSSAGNAKHWPKPYLLRDKGILAQVRRLVERSFSAVQGHVPKGPYRPSGAQLC